MFPCSYNVITHSITDYFRITVYVALPLCIYIYWVCPRALMTNTVYYVDIVLVIIFMLPSSYYCGVYRQWKTIQQKNVIKILPFFLMPQEKWVYSLTFQFVWHSVAGVISCNSEFWCHVQFANCSLTAIVGWDYRILSFLCTRLFIRKRHCSYSPLQCRVLKLSQCFPVLV